MTDVQGSAAEQRSEAAMHSTMRKQRFQDFIFHKLTLTFAASVLLVLIGIIVSLIMGAAPAFKEFGASFVTTVDWDPVNDKYGALIAIVGTLATSFIALLIVPVLTIGLWKICMPPAEWTPA